MRQTRPVRAELEIRALGREVIEAMARQANTQREVRSIPYVLYVDDFGIHRNMYRVFKAFYLTPANLSYPDRHKVANTFTFSLSPHGASLDDVANLLEPCWLALHRGVNVDIHGKETLLIGFPLLVTGDTLQQSDNAGLRGHNAEKGCRFCRG